MTHEELRDFILSRISLNQSYWTPRIDTLFEKNSVITRDTFKRFFAEESNNMRDGSIWAHMMRRSVGEEVSLEDIGQAGYEVDMAFDDLEMSVFQLEMAQYADQFRIKAIEAFNKNERYLCAIYYTLYAISLNKNLKDIFIKTFLMEQVFAPSLTVTAELSLDEAQQKEVVDCIFNRSSIAFGGCINSLDFSMVENKNIPFNVSGTSYSFFDFIGICKSPNVWPDIRKM